MCLGSRLVLFFVRITTHAVTRGLRRVTEPLGETQKHARVTACGTLLGLFGAGADFFFFEFFELGFPR